MKRTIVLLVITLVVAAWVYWMEVREDSRLRDTDEQEKVSKTLSGATSREITGFTLEKTGGEAIKAERFNEEWLLREPVSARAEDSTVREVLYDLEWTEKERTIGPEELSDDLIKEYGLDSPRGYLEIVTREGRKRFTIGGENPGGELVYVRAVEGGPVYLVKKALAENLDKTVFEMRNKSVITIEPAKAAFIKLAGPTRAELAKEGDDWNITDPFEDHADRENVMKLLDGAAKLRVQSFVSDYPESYEEYGLVNPDSPDVLEQGTYVTIGEGLGGGKVATVHFGWEAAGGEDGSKRLYAMVKGEPAIFTVPEAQASALFPGVEALQSKKATRFDPYAVNTLTISKGLTQVEFARRDFDWHILKPFEAPADNQAVKELLDAFKDAPVEEFATADPGITNEGTPDLGRYGLDVPTGSFSFVQGESQPAGLVFGKEADERTVYAKRSDTPGVFKVARTLFEKLGTPALEFHTREMQRISMDKADEIQIQRDGRTFALKAGAGSGVARVWRLAVPVDAPSNAAVAARITLALATTTATALVERNPSDISQYGLTEPMVRVSVTMPADQPQPKALLVGRAAESGDCYAMLEGGDMVFTIARDLVTTFRKELRKPQVLEFMPRDAERIELTRGDEVWRLVKSDGLWTVERPEGWSVDSALVEDELYHLARLETPQFVRYETAGLENFGLLQPRAVIRIETPSVVAALSTGDIESSGHHYATSSTVDGVFLISPGDILDVLDPTRLLTENTPAPEAETVEQVGDLPSEEAESD